MKKLFRFTIWSFLSIFIFFLISFLADTYLLKYYSQKCNFDFGTILVLASIIIGLFIGYYKSFHKDKIEFDEFRSFLTCASDFKTFCVKNDYKSHLNNCFFKTKNLELE
jgi:hypothetical protein